MDIPCTQCGGPVPLKRGEGFVACPSCQTALYVDVRKTVHHKIFHPRIQAPRVQEAVQGWLWKAECRARARVRRTALVYFPFWHVTLPSREVVLVQAAPTPVPLDDLAAPAGTASFFSPDAAQAAAIVPPQLTLDALRAQWQRSRKADPGPVHLLHLPFHDVELDYGGLSIPILLDALSGDVYTTHTPPCDSVHMDRKHALIFAGTFFVFFMEAWLVRGEGALLGWAAATGLGLYFGLRAFLERSR